VQLEADSNCGARFFVREQWTGDRVEGREEAMIQNFKDLMVWQRAKKFAIEVYKATKSFPRAEQFGLASQVRRAAISIPSNIAEGYARQYTGEFIQFLYMALGSAAELETQLIISEELRYMKEEELKGMLGILKEIQKMLNGLINSLREKAEAQ